MHLQQLYDTLQPMGITNQGFKLLVRYCANAGVLVKLQEMVERNDDKLLAVIIASNAGIIATEGGLIG
jgi:hypothetical protein